MTAPEETTESPLPPSTLDDSRPVWEQQSDERPLHYSRFQKYLQLGPSRSLLAAYNADRLARGKKPGTSVPSSWDEVALQWLWKERAVVYDQEQLRLERSAFEKARDEIWRKRLLSTQERLYTLSERLLGTVEQMAAFPIHRQTVEEEYEDGRPKKIVVEPANWSFGTMSTLVRGSDSILRLAFDLEKSRLKDVFDGMTDDEIRTQLEESLSQIGDEGHEEDLDTE